MEHSHLAPVVSDKRRAVTLHNERKLGSGERPVRDPVRQLVVPHTVVPAQLLAGAARKVRDDVRVVEREVARGRLGRELRPVLAAGGEQGGPG